MLILFSHIFLGLPSELFPSGYPTKTLYTPLLFPHTAHLILLDMINRTIVGEQYRSLSSSLYSFFLIPLLTLPSYAEIFSSAPYSQTPSAHVPPSMRATKFHTHTKQHTSLMSCYLALTHLVRVITTSLRSTRN
jgi:hypothetical protein